MYWRIFGWVQYPRRAYSEQSGAASAEPMNATTHHIGALHAVCRRTIFFRVFCR
jgi:hypothetical protein